MTPLHFASENGSTEIFQYLVENGADFDSKDKILIVLLMELHRFT